MKIGSFAAVALAALLAFAAIGIASAQTSGGGVLVRPDGIYLRCSQCGTVTSIEQNVSKSSGHGVAGAVVGALAGGLLGNRIGKGKGRKLATVAGAAGGGLAGNKIGKGGTSRSWTVRVKMGNGSLMNVEVADASTLRVGDLVEVEKNGNITRIR